MVSGGPPPGLCMPNAPDPDCLLLPAVLDLGTAPVLRQHLLAAWATGAPVLDGRLVERVTTPGLQVLAAAARGGVAFRLRHASAALATAIDDLGLSEAIPCED